MEDDIGAEKKKLFAAAERNDLSTVKVFFDEAFIPVKITNIEKQTVAHVAAKNGYLEMVKYMAEKSPSILAERDGKRETVFTLALEKGALDVIKYIMDEHPEATTEDFFTVQTAVQCGHLHVLKYLIEERNIDVEILNRMNETPLFLAVESEHPDIIEYLMEEKQANLTVLNINRENLLFMTVVNNDLPLMRRLWDEKKLPFHVDYKNRYGDTLLHTAAIMNRTAIARYLVDEKNASLNIQGTEGMTPLHCAACRDFTELCEFLCERGADPRIMDDEDHLPWQTAFDPDLIKYLNASASRTRRAILPSMLYEPIPTYNDTDFVGQLNGEQAGEACISSVSLRSFLLVAQCLMRKSLGLFGCNSKDESLPFMSHSQILSMKMDSSAVDAVYDFEES